MIDYEDHAISIIFSEGNALEFETGKRWIDVQVTVDNNTLAVSAARRSMHPIDAIRIVIDCECCLEVLMRPQYTADFSAIRYINDQNVDIPHKYYDNRLHRYDIYEGGNLLYSGSFVFSHQYSGHLDLIDAYQMSGWLINHSTDFPEEIELYIDGIFNHSFIANQNRPDVLGAGYLRQNVGFIERLQEDTTKQSKGIIRVVELRSAKTGVPLLGSPFFLDARRQIEKVIRDLASVFLEAELTAQNHVSCDARSSASGLNNLALKFIRTQMLQELGNNVNRMSDSPQYGARHHKRKEVENIIDIIVPVYAGFSQTVRCITSVLNARCSMSWRLIIINDCTEDPKIEDFLEAVADDQHILLIRNSTNLGYVASINKGIAQSDNRHVVLLNADTEVVDGWIDGLTAPLQDARVGTVTPLSNNATVFSYPDSKEQVPPFEVSLLRAINEVAARVNRGRAVVSPTCHGFCVLINRLCLEEVGSFDQDLWGRGYCEENDFSQRAIMLGWRNVVVGSVLVNHWAETSFGNERKSLISKNHSKLLARFPSYDLDVAEFVAIDELSQMRNRIGVELLRTSSKKFFVHVLHNMGGGTAVNVDSMELHLSQTGIRSLLVTPSERHPGGILLTCREISVKVEYHKHELTIFRRDLESFPVLHMHVHHIAGFGLRELQYILGASIPKDYTLHDYIYICPRINMISVSVYCGGAEIDKCSRCLIRNGPHEVLTSIYNELGGSIFKWREHWRGELEKARLIYFPSKIACELYGDFIVSSKRRIRHHPEKPMSRRLTSGARSSRVRVAVIGSIGPHKGSKLLLECVRQAKENDLKIDFIVVGHTDVDSDLRELGVQITGRYESGDLRAILRSLRCSVALFLSIWPETHSYTLTEALRAGLTPVAIDIGAIAERMRRYEIGFLSPFPPSIIGILECILRYRTEFESVKHKTITVGHQYADIIENYYEMGSVS
ncbi:glycosyltransferase [Methylobacterium hispanicum]|uniref:glycosyltransferase n=1 Tax=Methylobacterium hispanicum TaxID=270350 RepID=UPI002F3554AB